MHEGPALTHREICVIYRQNLGVVHPGSPMVESYMHLLQDDHARTP